MPMCADVLSHRRRGCNARASKGPFVQASLESLCCFLKALFALISLEDITRSLQIRRGLSTWYVLDWSITRKAFVLGRGGVHIHGVNLVTDFLLRIALFNLCYAAVGVVCNPIETLWTVQPLLLLWP